MFMNYMDYVDDDAMFMFTAGQVGPDAGVPRRRSQPPSAPSQPAATLKFTDDGGAPPSRSTTWRPPPSSSTTTAAPALKFRDDTPPPSSSATTRPPRSSSVTTSSRPSIPRRWPRTLKFRDDGGTLKFIDDWKIPGLGKQPAADMPTFPGGAFPFRGGGRAAPFVLATPHHSMASTSDSPDAARNALAAYEQQSSSTRRL